MVAQTESIPKLILGSNRHIEQKNRLNENLVKGCSRWRAKEGERAGWGKIVVIEKREGGGGVEWKIVALRSSFEEHGGGVKQLQGSDWRFVE
jgi:hypothetical protein